MHRASRCSRCSLRWASPRSRPAHLEVHADLRGAGATPHAIAAASMVRLASPWPTAPWTTACSAARSARSCARSSLLDLVGRGGTSQVQCFAVAPRCQPWDRHGAHAGARIRRCSPWIGDGSINLGAETLDLRVRPQARVAGTGLVVPLRVTGTFRSPSAAPDPAAAVAPMRAPWRASRSGATPLGMVAGALGGQKLLGGGEAADCGPALAIARGRPPARADAGSRASRHQSPSAEAAAEAA